MSRSQAIELLARHALATMPDSLSHRIQVLDAMVQALPLGHASRIEAATLKTQLETHQDRLAQIQGELDFGTK